MKNYEITTVEDMNVNSLIIEKLIKKRIERGFTCNDELEKEIYKRQQAEDNYLSGFEYNLGL